MLALKIAEPNIRLFMNGVLREKVFDAFEVRSVEISHMAKFEINGSLDRDFLPEGTEISESRGFCLWAELKPYVFSIIKGGKRPKSMKFVFSYPSDKAEEINANAASLFLNVAFLSDEILCTTASSQKNFAMDKTVDIVWDDYVKKIFETNEFVFTLE